MQHEPSAKEAVVDKRRHVPLPSARRKQPRIYCGRRQIAVGCQARYGDTADFPQFLQRHRSKHSPPPPLAKIGRLRRGPRVYSIKASSRLKSITSIPRGCSESNNRRCSLVETDHHQLQLAADLPAVDQPGTGRKLGRLAVELQNHLADRVLEMIGGTIDPQHAVHQNPDPVGHPLHVAEDVRAEQDRPAATLNDLDQRFQEIAANDRIQAQRRIVEDQHFRVGGHGQRQRHLRLLAAREPANPPLRAKARNGRESAPTGAGSSGRRTSG